MSTDRGTDKEDVHTYPVEYYSAIKTQRNAFCSSMDRPRDYHTKWSERQIPKDITYMWNLK